MRPPMVGMAMRTSTDFSSRIRSDLTSCSPGDSVTAMLLGGFLIHGIQPGPLLFQNNGELVYSIFVALLVASIVMLCLLYFGLRYFWRWPRFM